jgi:hypothetical protein
MSGKGSYYGDDGYSKGKVSFVGDPFIGNTITSGLIVLLRFFFNISREKVV